MLFTSNIAQNTVTFSGRDIDIYPTGKSAHHFPKNHTIVIFLNEMVYFSVFLKITPDNGAFFVYFCRKIPHFTDSLRLFQFCTKYGHFFKIIDGIHSVDFQLK